MKKNIDFSKIDTEIIEAIKIEIGYLLNEMNLKGLKNKNEKKIIIEIANHKNVQCLIDDNHPFDSCDFSHCVIKPKLLKLPLSSLIL